MRIVKIGVRILALVLAVPFITYGFLGIIKCLGLARFIESYVGSYDKPVVAIILVVIGVCLLYGLNTLADKMK